MALCRRRICVLGVRGSGKSALLDIALRGIKGWITHDVRERLDFHAHRASRLPATKLDTALRRVVRQRTSEGLLADAHKAAKGLICEGHMAHAPVGDPGKFQEEAFTDYDKTLFNEVVLVEADPYEVLARRPEQPGVEGAAGVDVIKDEMRRERDFAIELCRETGARLRVVDASIPDRAVGMLRGYLRSPGVYSETFPMTHRRAIEAKASRFAESARGQPVFLFDADGTLMAGDVSEMFMEELAEMRGNEAAKDEMHRNFRERGKSFASYVVHDLIHRRFAAGKLSEICQRVAARVELFPGVRQCLVDALAAGRVAILTAGIPAVWKRVFEREDLTGISIFGLVDERSRYVMDEQGKEAFARVIKRHGHRVVACGDSVIDLGMMRASDAAFMVVSWPDREKVGEKPTEPSEISKMHMMFGRYHGIWRIKASPSVDLVLGPPECAWSELVPLALGGFDSKR
jgi:phosphoserine phosphatase/adenylate kinase